MKRLRNKIISCSLAVIIAFTVSVSFNRYAPVTANAASKEEFLSEVALVYENSVEKAKEAIAGTEWKLFEKDLNKNADPVFQNGVYLIYKTTADVEEAITDLRVMDMYGGFTTTNYKNELEKTRKEYEAKIDELRIVADEFATLYAEGDGMAQLAYRQMNYYKDAKTENGTETDMLMGEFFLKMPTDKNKIIQVLFEGNAVIVSNLISLLAVGISGDGEETLSTRIAEKYAIKDSLTDEEYNESAITLGKAFDEIKTKLIRYDALKAEYNFEDEEMSEEEYVFLIEYAAIADLMTTIKYGDKTLAEFIVKDAWKTKDLYPIVAAFTPGQKALVNMGQLETILKYNKPSKPIAELNQALEKVEEGLKDENGNIKSFDVYMGVDREIFKGDFAMTNEAKRQQALTGKTWGLSDAADRPLGMIIGYIVAGVVDIAMASTAVGLAIKASTLKAATAPIMVETLEAITITGGFKSTVVSIPNRAAEKAFASFTAKWSGVQSALGVAAIALDVIIAGSYGISTWYNYYNPDYTAIPNTMIDVKETDVGDKYIKYTAAKTFGDDDNKNADFNGYGGREWNALYYTKDANAGNCLTPNFVCREDNNSVSRRHQGVSMFGEDKAYNLNSHVYKKGAPGLYLTVRYSTAKKAASDFPSIIGSILIPGGYYVLTGLLGAGIGAGLVTLAKKNKSSKRDEESVEKIATAEKE